MTSLYLIGVTANHHLVINGSAIFINSFATDLLFFDLSISDCFLVMPILIGSMIYLFIYFGVYVYRLARVQGNHGMICTAKLKDPLHMTCLKTLSSDGRRQQNGRNLDGVSKGYLVGRMMPWYSWNASHGYSVLAPHPFQMMILLYGNPVRMILKTGTCRLGEACFWKHGIW